MGLKSPNYFQEILSKLKEKLQKADTLIFSNTANFDSMMTIYNSSKHQIKGRKIEETTLFLSFDDIVKQLKKKKKTSEKIKNYNNLLSPSLTKKMQSKILSSKSVNMIDDGRSAGSRVHTVKIDPNLQPILESEENVPATCKNRTISPFTGLELTDRTENNKAFVRKKTTQQTTFSPLYPKVPKKRIHNKNIYYSTSQKSEKSKLKKKSYSLEFFDEDDDVKRNITKSFENLLFDVKDFRGADLMESI